MIWQTVAWTTRGLALLLLIAACVVLAVDCSQPYFEYIGFFRGIEHVRWYLAVQWLLEPRKAMADVRLFVLGAWLLCLLVLAAASPFLVFACSRSRKIWTALLILSWLLAAAPRLHYAAYRPSQLGQMSFRPLLATAVLLNFSGLFLAGLVPPCRALSSHHCNKRRSMSDSTLSE